MIIRRKYGFITVLLLVMLVPHVRAQNNMEGTVLVGRYDEFPPGGLYIASNVFPLNTIVSVTNMQSGRTARMIVARTVDDPGVFMLLSEAAARELGVTSADTIDVRVEPVQLPGLTSVDPNRDLPFHPDPDVNPAASLGDPNASIIRPDQRDDTPAIVDAPAVDESDFAGDGAIVGTAPTIATRIVEGSGAPEVSIPRVNPVARPPLSVGLAILEDRDEAPRIPAASIPAPAPVPVDDPLARRIAEVESELAREQIAAAPLGTPPVGAMAHPIADDSGAEPSPLIAESPMSVPEQPNPARVVDELPLVEVQTMPHATIAAPVRPEVGPGEFTLPWVSVESNLEDEAGPLRPTKIPDSSIVTLEPAEDRSPEPPESETSAEPEIEEADIAATAAAEPADDVSPIDAPGIDRGWATENLPLIPRLASGSSYVQVAAFSNPRSAKQMVDAIGDGFPVAVVSHSGADKEVFRIFVGPLREDEKGSALHALRRRGFRDAFVRDAP